jgi:hypothetical protein
VPISYHLQALRSTSLVRVTMTGVIAAEALAPHLLQLGEQRLFGLAELIDMRGARLRWSGEEMRWIARLVDVLRRLYGPAAVSVVADEEDTFDLLIRYLLVAGDTDPGLGVFRDLGEAEAWLHGREFSSPSPDRAFSSGWRVHAPAGLEPKRTPATPRVLGYARVRPGLAPRALGLDPTHWYPVTEQPAGVLAAPVEGHVWLDDAGHARHVPLRLVEIIWGPAEPA